MVTSFLFSVFITSFVVSVGTALLLSIAGIIGQ